MYAKSFTHPNSLRSVWHESKFRNKKTLLVCLRLPSNVLLRTFTSYSCSDVPKSVMHVQGCYFVFMSLLTIRQRQCPWKRSSEILSLRVLELSRHYFKLFSHLKVGKLSLGYVNLRGARPSSESKDFRLAVYFLRLKIRSLHVLIVEESNSKEIKRKKACSRTELLFSLLTY